ncbi:MAG: endo-1,3-alpha-glucanase family glycosylhydrolase [Planctomycetota bacterium]
MKQILIAGILFGFMVPLIAQDAGKTKAGLLDFLKERRDRRWTKTPHQVLAFYYTWYGRPENHGKWVHWSDVKPEAHDIASSTHYPAKGAYDSHDPAIIDYHIDLAKSHGVDGFICTWWGQGGFDDRAFAKVLDHAAKKDFKLTVYWETVPGEGQKKIERAVSDLSYILEKYADHPAFLKVDGKPVVFIYGRVMGQVSLTEWPEIITRVRERTGKDFLLIADGFRDSYAAVFDGIHTYNICGWVRGKSAEELAEASKKAFTDAVAMAKNRANISCITIIPGYDDTKIRKPGINTGRMDGETYRILWEQAITADPDWVLITSWNEWHEGSEIEPSHEDGNKYIQMTGKYAAQFKQREYSQVPAPAAPPGVSPEKAKALQEMYQGKTIGVLPGFQGGAVFWLVDAGLNVKALSGEDLLDPAVLNAKNMPVVVYAGFEDYVQSVKEDGDADRALVRYLNEGGLVMSLGAGPFPFYRNEKEKSVVSAGKFGFPICGSGAFGREDVPREAVCRGWESPPDGARLTFHVDNKILAGLPETAPFPTAGDLRWRPCNGAVLPDGDVYLPLAQLKDYAGKSYGDGVVYIEHCVSPPKNGKNIYVWTRMTDVLDREGLLFNIFRLAAEKMTK